MLLSETLKAQSVYHLEKIDLITAHKYLYGEKKILNSEGLFNLVENNVPRSCGRN